MKIKALQNKKVAIFGYGREGRSVLQAIRRQLPDLPLTVLNDSPLELTEPQVAVISGAAAQARLTEFDLIIKSPGISAYRADIRAAQQQGVCFTSATRLWFAEHPQAQTLCVTGTKGKSTSAALLAHLLQAAGQRVALGGNIGKPLFELPDDPAPDYWVIELSSYQTSDFDGQPSLSLLLNLFPEHLDWHGDVSTYFHDKLNLLRQTQSGHVLLNARDTLTQQYAQGFENALYFNTPEGFHQDAHWLYQGATPLLALADLPLRGAHNAANLCAVLTAIQALGIEAQDCLPAVANFQGLPHRLSVLGAKRGVTYVDDSISTTPQSAIAAVQAFPQHFITLLLGGYERGLDWNALAEFAQQRPIQAIITLPDNGERIAATLRQHCSPDAPPQLHAAADLAAAVTLAQRITPAGGVILLSPGAPSYGRFNNYQERGQQFAALTGIELE